MFFIGSDIFDAMFPCEYKADDIIIKQGLYKLF